MAGLSSGLLQVFWSCFARSPVLAVRYAVLLLVVVALLVLTACASPSPTPTSTPILSRPTPTPTFVVPTATPDIRATIAAGVQATIEGQPVRTATATATAIQKPTATPTPTATSTPIPTTQPSPCPSYEESLYLAKISEILTSIGGNLDQLGALFISASNNSALFFDEQWMSEVVIILVILELNVEEIRDATVIPPSILHIQSDMEDLANIIELYVDTLTRGLDNSDPNLISAATDILYNAEGLPASVLNKVQALCDTRDPINE